MKCPTCKEEMLGLNGPPFCPKCATGGGRADTIALVRRYNLRRRGDESLEMERPKVIGEALDAICDHAESMQNELLTMREIETAPKDGTEIVVYCPSAHGIRHMASICAWHADAGFCVDELREPTHWMPLPILGQNAKGQQSQDSLPIK